MRSSNDSKKRNTNVYLLRVAQTAIAVNACPGAETRAVSAPGNPGLQKLTASL
jgi:hypothetical protein